MKKGTASTVTVAVRVRPLSEKEQKIPEQSFALDYGDKHVSLPNESTYVFDSVFGPEHSTQALYNAIAEPIVSSSLAGINGTLFAYGQTASGKTFTMQGSEEDPGILRLAARQLFQVAETAEWTYAFVVSYVEIYNERVKDLLNPAAGRNAQDAANDLKVREDRLNGFYVDGVTERIVSDYEALIDVFEEGEKRRHVAGTDMNLKSSRSHTIFTINVTAKQKPNETGDFAFGTLKSRLSLVDLAGSESARMTNAEGDRLKEGAQINKSLLSLSLVISTLAKSGGKDAHVKFRDSKLTQILQPSLAGNCRTAVICCVTPASTFLSETASTLKFASSAKHIQTQYVVNQISDATRSMKSYQEQVEALTKALQDERVARGAAESVATCVNMNRVSEMQEELSALTLALEKSTSERNLLLTKLADAEAKLVEAASRVQSAETAFAQAANSTSVMQQSLRDQVELERLEWRKLLSAMQSQLEESISQLKMSLAEKEVSLAAESLKARKLEAELDEVKAKLQEREKILGAELKDRETIMLTEHNTAMNALKVEHQRYMSECGVLQAEMESMKRNEHEDREKWASTVEGLQSDLQQETTKREEQELVVNGLREELRVAHAEAENHDRAMQTEMNMRLKEMKEVFEAERIGLVEAHAKYVASLKTEHDALVQSAISRHDRDVSETNAKIQELSRESREKAAEFSSEKELLSMAVGNLEDRLRETNEQASVLRIALMDATESLGRNEANLAQEALKRRDLEAKLVELQTTLEMERSALADTNLDWKRHLESVADESNKRIAELESRVAEERSKAATLKEQMSTLKADMQRQKQEHDSELETLRALGQDSEEAQVIALRAELTQQQTQRRAIQQQYDNFRLAAERESSTKEQEIEELKALMEGKVTEELKGELDDARDRLRSLRDVYERDKEQLRQEFGEQIKKKDERIQELEKVKITREFKDFVDSLKSEVVRLRQLKENLEGELSKYKARYEGAVRRMQKSMQETATCDEDDENRCPL